MGGWEWNWTAKVIMHGLGCKSLSVCACALYCMCVAVGIFISLCVCVKERPLTPERLSSLSSEATGVQRVCFHTPLLRYNSGHFFFLPSFHLSSLVLPHLSFCFFSSSVPWNPSLHPLYSPLRAPPPPILTPFLHSIPAVLNCLAVLSLHGVTPLNSSSSPLVFHCQKL